MSAADVPDYHDVIKQPMDWLTISSRIESLFYAGADDFCADVELVFTNAIVYNAPDTPFHKAAAKMRKQSARVLDEVRAKLPHDAHGLEPSDAAVALLDEHPDSVTGELPARARDVDPLADDADIFDAFLHQSYVVEADERGPTPAAQEGVPRTAKKARRIEARKPERRSTRSAPHRPEPAAPVTAPQEVHAVNEKDSFKYFNVGWLLPPGTRRGNRPPRPPPVEKAPRRSA